MRRPDLLLYKPIKRHRTHPVYDHQLYPKKKLFNVSFFVFNDRIFIFYCIQDVPVSFSGYLIDTLDRSLL